MEVSTDELNLEKSSDYAVWSGILRESLKLSPEAFALGFKELSAMAKDDQLKYFRGIRFWVAKEGEEIVGMVSVDPSDNGGAGPDGFYMRNLFVSPRKRKLGIGSLLIKKAEDFSREIGETKLLLSVYDTQRDAIRSYIKAGYIEAVRGESTSKPGVDWVVMEKLLL